MEDGCNNKTMDIIKELQSENEILKEEVRKLTEENRELRQEAARSTNITRRVDKHSDSLDDSSQLTERKQVYRSTAVPDKVPSLVVSKLPDTLKHVKGEITSTTNACSEIGPPAFNFQSTVSGSNTTWLSRMTTQLSTCTYDVEMHMHHSLCRAVSQHCEELASIGCDHVLLDYLLQEGCIAYEEYHLCRQSNNINYMRVLVLKMLRRDCKTLASFVGVLLECIGFQYIGEPIVSQYEAYVREPMQSVHTDDYCCHCLLRNQVEICLIIDKLLQHDYRVWISLYEKVSLSGNSGRNQTFWDEFMALANECGQSFILSERLIEWLSGIGFHSDIVRKLRKDLQEGCNSFLCKHLTLRKIPTSAPNGLLAKLENIPSDSEELESTKCKQIISENTARKQLVWEKTTCGNEDSENQTFKHEEENTTCKQVYEELDTTTPKYIDAEAETVNKGENGPVVPQNSSDIDRRIGFESVGSNPSAYQALPYIMNSHQVRNGGESEDTTHFCELKEFKICRNEGSEMTACENDDFENTAIENEDLGVTTHEYKNLEITACENEDLEYTACEKGNLENTACKHVDLENTLPKCVYRESDSSIANMEDSDQFTSMNTPEGDSDVLIVLICYSIAYFAMSYILIDDTP